MKIQRTSILMFAANPLTTDFLQLDLEVKGIREQVRSSAYSDQLMLDCCHATRARDLLDELNRVIPSVIHFSGHGSSQMIFLADEHNSVDGIAEEQFKHFASVASKYARLVVLNACESDGLASSAVSHIDCAIGFEGKITDSSAICFSRAFYRALANGCSVDESFKEAKAALHIESHNEYQRVKLYERKPGISKILSLASDPALALRPQSYPYRPLNESGLIGRDAELRWLEERLSTKSACLIVGQPGVGKSYLLYSVLKASGARFAAGRDIGPVIAALQRRCPSVVIVDDAHTRSELLRELVQLRSQTGANFGLIASCWPGDLASVQACLGIGNKDVLEVDLLSRDQMVEVIKVNGILGPNPLISLLVDQAAGRPGLAATLCDLCKHGNIHDVVTGDALYRNILSTLENLIDQPTSSLLGIFAISGDRGMSLGEAALHLKMSEPSIRERVVELTDRGVGVLLQVRGKNMAVYPKSLRYALIREVFFCGTAVLDVRPFVEIEPSVPDVERLRVIINACHHGIEIPLHQLKNWLQLAAKSKAQRASCQVAFRAFAGLSAETCEWVLDECPDDLLSLSPIALEYLPEKVILSLLMLAQQDDHSAEERKNGPGFAELVHWIKTADPGRDEALRRRRELLDETLRWYQRGGDLRTVLRSCSLALSPSFDRSEVLPGSGNTVQISNGWLGMQHLEELGRMWARLLDVLRTASAIPSWTPIRSLVNEWVRVVPGATLPSDEYLQAVRAISRQMVKDIVPLVGQRPGMVRWIKSLSSELWQGLTLPEHKEFDRLYPIPKRSAIEDDGTAFNVAIKALASDWLKESPEEILSRLESYLSEGRGVGLTDPNLAYFACHEVSRLCNDPLNWVIAFSERQLPYDWLDPFLTRSLLINQQGTEEKLYEFLNNRHYRRAAFRAILQVGIEKLEAWRICELDENEDLFVDDLKSMLINNRVHKRLFSKLLSHSNSTISETTATWLYHSEALRIYLEDHTICHLWREAIVRNLSPDFHMLHKLREKDPEIIYDWMRYQLAKSEQADLYISNEHEMTALAAILTEEQKLKILADPELQPRLGWLISSLIGNSLPLYQALLKMDNLNRYHLNPLVIHVDTIREVMPSMSEIWVAFALAALDHGYEPKDIVQAVNGGTFGYCGRESDQLTKWQACCRSLIPESDSRIKRIGEILDTQIQRRLASALDRERLQGIYGRGGLMNDM